MGSTVAAPFACAIAVAVTTTALAADRERLLVMPIKADAPGDAAYARQLDRFVLIAIKAFPEFSVVSTEDIEIQLRLEKAKDAIGCDSVSCVAELAGALDVQQVLVGELGQLGQSYQLLLKLVRVGASTETLNAINREIPFSEQERSQTFVAQAIGNLVAGPAYIGGSDAPTLPQPTAEPGQLSITTQPPGARIFLDAKDKGTSPTRIARLAPGSHQLLLKKDGYIPLTKDVAVRSGQTTAVSETLAIQRGRLLVESEPPHAKCYLDGSPRGETPCDLEALPVGKYRVKLRLEGYEQHVEELSVAYKRTRHHRVDLTPLPVHIVLATVPSGAELSIDGDALGTTDYAGKVAPGEHRVRFVKKGYDDLEETVEVGINKPEVFSFTLVPGISQTERRRRFIERIARWSLTGLAVASAAVWAWQGVTAADYDSRAAQMRVTDPDFEITASNGRTAAAVADIAMVATILSAAGAGYFWLTLDF